MTTYLIGWVKGTETDIILADVSGPWLLSHETHGGDHEKAEAAAAVLGTHKLNTWDCIKSISTPLVSGSHCNLGTSRGAREERQQGIEGASTSGRKRWGLMHSVHWVTWRGHTISPCSALTTPENHDISCTHCCVHFLR